MSYDANVLEKIVGARQLELPVISGESINPVAASSAKKAIVLEFKSLWGL
jgi:hypothetical protein